MKTYRKIAGLTRLFFLGLVIFVPMVVLAQQDSRAYEVVLNREEALGESNIKHRHIFVLADDSAFKLETITKYLKDLSEKYKEPTLLRISIYSDKDMLNKLIRFESQVWAIEFRTDEQGKKSEKEFYDKVYPKSHGYFRVTYYRQASSELFDYSPEKDSPETTRIYLKGTGIDKL